MAQLETTRFGSLDCDPDGVIDFPRGVPGFECERRFVLIEQPAAAPLVFLQSLDTPALCLPAVPLAAIDPQYRMEVSAEDLETLRLDPQRQPEPGAEVLCLAIVALHEGAASANLLAPIVIHLAERTGVQAVRSDSRYSHCHPLGAACS